RPLPGLGRLLAQEPANRLGVELALVPEVAIEAAVRQPGLVHDFVDRDVDKALGIEQAARAFENALTGLELVGGRIGHDVLRLQKMMLNIFWLARGCAPRPEDSMLDFLGTLATTGLTVFVVSTLLVHVEMARGSKIVLAVLLGLWIGLA